MVEKDYSIITELPNTKIPIEQLERFYQRYKFAQKFSHNKRILEIGCGGGQGLDLLAQDAISVKGIDIERSNLDVAQSEYKNHRKVSVEYNDANQLHLLKNSFDLIILFEVIYYLRDAQDVIRVCKNILSDKGVIIIASANKEWKDFNPSPFANVYYTVYELNKMLKKLDFKNVDMFRSCKIDDKPSITSTAISRLKRLAVKWNLIPGSMKHKKILKWLFFGKLLFLPPRLYDNMCNYIEPEKIDPENYNSQFKTIYAVGYKI